MPTITYSGRQTTMRIASFSPEMQAEDQFRREIAQWFFAATQCRIEVALLTDTSKADDQRAFLSSLITWGEWAQQQVRTKAIDLSPIGVKIEDVAAETRLLRDTYRSAFENALSVQEAESVLKEVFG
jgi:hypothetical protein